MKRRDALEEYDKHLDRPGSVEIARDAIQRQLSWLEWVPESEMLITERARLLRAIREFYAVVRPLTEKYIDD